MTFPARGTWIEIKMRRATSYPFATFPARGTWIEIIIGDVGGENVVDVPRKGNVDRNADG